jgi:hypothetical protein
VTMTLSQFRDRTVMPSEDVDDLQARYPGWLGETLADEYSAICDRLKKRYQVPFEPTLPRTVARWLNHIVTELAYEKRGYNPTSAQDEKISERAERARAEVLEAANSETGLFELPLRQETSDGSGVTKGGPYVYSEQSPYTWTDVQREAVRYGR